MQHGEARPESEDPARALSARGRQAVERVARAAARSGVRPAWVAHSGKLRARQTAEILAEALRPPRGLREVAGLAPLDDPGTALAALEREAEAQMLVGHLPHLGRLASRLVVGNESEIIAFRMGAIVCLVQREGAWRVAWILTPEHAT